MKIAIFCHLYQVNNWRNILDEQIQKICSSGLYGACDFIHLGINGNDPLPYTLPKISSIRNLYTVSEADTLKALWEYSSQNPDSKVLYLNSLGVTHYGTSWEYSKNSWRIYLEYFAIQRWKECIEKLEEYDTVGTEFIKESNYWDSKKNWREEFNWHYSGIFWWANSSYIQKLDPNYLYTDHDNNLRMRPEFWVGTLKPKYFSFYNTNAPCRYAHVYNPLEYITI